MKRAIWIALVTAAAALAAPACGGKKDEPQPATTGSGSAMAGSGSAMAGSGSAMAGSDSAMAGSGSDAAAADEVDVPTEVDFEADAAAKITEKTLEAELKAVEQELAR